MKEFVWVALAPPLPQSENARQQTSIKPPTFQDGYDGRLGTGGSWVQRTVARRTLYATATYALRSLARPKSRNGWSKGGREGTRPARASDRHERTRLKGKGKTSGRVRNRAAKPYREQTRTAWVLFSFLRWWELPGRFPGTGTVGDAGRF